MSPVSASNQLDANTYQQTVIDTNKVDIRTQAHIQYPLTHVKINQSYSFFHPGVDLDGEIGDTVKPIMEGVVAEIQHSSFSYGNAILIRHAEGFSSIYAHLSKIEVEVGQKVSLSTKIGEVGSTGHSTGPHLHLEVRENGVAINPFSMLP
jgi:murein DD-endopeptidase MepM/ murein hydrolase activator NlpD